MPLLSKAEILGAKDLAFEDVEVPEWGGTVRVRTMSGTQRDGWETSFVKLDGKGVRLDDIAANVRARLVAFTVIDEAGELVFTMADIVELGKKSAAALDRVFAVAQRLNAIGQQDLEELGKFFAAIQGGASTTS